MTRTAVLLLCPTLVLSACGGTGDSTADTETTVRRTATTTEEDVETAAAPTEPDGTRVEAPTEGTNGDEEVGVRGRPREEGSSASPPAPPDPVRASVARACVKPGGRQELRVDGAPGHHVRFFTTYSGGGAGGDGDSGEGELADDGTFQASWVVPDGTPSGQAVVGVFTTGPDGGNSGTDSAGFDVADAAGLCPPRMPWPG